MDWTSRSCFCFFFHALITVMIHDTQCTFPEKMYFFTKNPAALKHGDLAAKVKGFEVNLFP